MHCWEAQTGRLVAPLEAHTDVVYALDLNADGRYLLSGGGDRALRLWDMVSGQCVRVFEPQGESAFDVALSDGGKFALSGDAKLVRLWEVESGKCIRTFTGHGGNVNAVHLSPDARLALSGGGRIDMRDVRYDCTVRCWDTNSGRCLKVMQGHTSEIHGLALTRNGRWAISAGEDRTLRLWDAQTGRCAYTFRGHTRGVNSVAVGADGRQAVSGSIDKTLRLWALGTTTNDGSPLYQAPWVLCRVAGGQELLAEEQRFRSLLRQAQEAAEQERYAAAALVAEEARGVRGHERSAEVLNLQALLAQRLPTAAIQEAWGVRRFTGHEDAVSMACFSPDGKRILSGSADRTMRLWDTATGRCLSVFEHKLGLGAVALAPDGRWAVSGDQNWTVHLWDLESGQRLREFKGHSGPIHDLCFSPDGRWVLSGGGDPMGSRDPTVRLWDPATGRCLRTFYGHTSAVWSVCLSADGRLAWSSGWDWEVRCWDVASGRCLYCAAHGEPPVSSLCCTPDDRFVLVGAAAGVQVRERDSGQLVRCFQGKSPSRPVAVSPDGRWAASGGLDIWEIESGRCLLTRIIQEFGNS